LNAAVGLNAFVNGSKTPLRRGSQGKQEEKSVHGDDGS